MESADSNYLYVHDRVEFYTMDINLNHKQLDDLIYARKQHAVAYHMTNDIESKENIIQIINGINTSINLLMGTHKTF